MPRGTNKGSRGADYREVPARPSINQQSGTAPDFGAAPRFIDCCNMLMRQRIYLGLQAAADGELIILTLLNGGDRRRYYAHSEEELRDAIDAIYEEFCDVTVD